MLDPATKSPSNVVNISRGEPARVERNHPADLGSSKQPMNISNQFPASCGVENGATKVAQDIAVTPGAKDV